MTTLPEALRLADALQQQAVWEGHYGPSYLRDLLPEAADELRRLHAENEDLRRCAEVEEVEKYAAANRRLHTLNGELLAALKLAVRQNEHDMLMTGEELRICDAAIARAEGKV